MQQKVGYAAGGNQKHNSLHGNCQAPVSLVQPKCHSTLCLLLSNQCQEPAALHSKAYAPDQGAPSMLMRRAWPHRTASTPHATQKQEGRKQAAGAVGSAAGAGAGAAAAAPVHLWPRLLVAAVLQGQSSLMLGPQEGQREERELGLLHLSRRHPHKAVPGDSCLCKRVRRRRVLKCEAQDAKITCARARGLGGAEREGMSPVYKRGHRRTM
eukprot:scaffold12143_cov18-Tisochrysis_lutea.AAC.2